jgi:rsbT co-antagonist protein RsbR
VRSFEDTSSFFLDPKVLQRVKNAYFLRLSQGDYDLAYAQNRSGSKRFMSA